MKEMIYGGESGLLHVEAIDDYEIAVVNVRGSHPCGYVKVPVALYIAIVNENNEDEDGYSADYDAFNCLFSVHGGFTYAGETPNEVLSGDTWIGWDYAHAGDYVYQGFHGFSFAREDEKRWTTEEVVEEAKNVISQLNDYRKESCYETIA